jgi:hypothetical protein
MSESETFYKASRGNFSSLLRWQQLDEFCNVVRRNARRRLAHEPDSTTTDRKPASVARHSPTLVADSLT